MSEEIYQRVVAVIVDVLKCDPSKIARESRFVEDLGAASIQSVELMAGFEDEFDVEIDEKKAAQMKTVGSAADYLVGLLDA